MMAAKVLRESLKPDPKELERILGKTPEKTWEELTAEEREQLMKQLAENLGYVKKP